MEENCIICLDKTNFNLKHYLCCQCAAIICYNCLSLKETSTIEKCPKCNYRLQYSSILKCDYILLRRYPNNSIIHNKLGCYQFLHYSFEMAIFHFEKSDLELAKENLKLITGKIKNKIIFGDDSTFFSDLRYFTGKTEKIIDSYCNILCMNDIKKIIEYLFYNSKFRNKILEICKKYSDNNFFKHKISIEYIYNNKYDYQEGINMLESLVKQNYHNSYFSYAIILLIDKKNYKKAFRYFVKSNNKKSFSYISYMYYKGLYVQKNLDKYFYFLKMSNDIEDILQFGFEKYIENYKKVLVDNYVD